MSAYRHPSIENEPIPEHSNFFGTVAADSRESVAALFAASGWETRKCGFDEFLLESPFAELVLDGPYPFLLHGQVADVLSNAKVIADVLGRAHLEFSLECCSESQELVGKIESVSAV